MNNMQDLGGGLWLNTDDNNIYDDLGNFVMSNSTVDTSSAPDTSWLTGHAGSQVPAPTDPVLADQAASAAEQGTLDQFSSSLLKLGTTASQLAMLYQNVQSSKQLTPIALNNLQKQQTYLQTQTQSSQTMWMWVAIAAGAFLVLSRR